MVFARVVLSRSDLRKRRASECAKYTVNLNNPVPSGGGVALRVVTDGNDINIETMVHSQQRTSESAQYSIGANDGQQIDRRFTSTAAFTFCKWVRRLTGTATQRRLQYSVMGRLRERFPERARRNG
jgi:hypothetical protein